MRRAGLIVGMVTLAACLRTLEAADYSTPRATFETYWAAAKAGNPEAMAACCAKADQAKAREELAKTDLDDMRHESGRARVTFGQEWIEGDQAAVLITIDGEAEVYDFVREADGWKLLAEPREATQVDVKPDYSTPTATFQTFWRAARAGARTILLDCLAERDQSKVRKDFEERDTAEFRADAFRMRIEMGTERIAGNWATLEATINDRKETVYFVRERDGWRVLLDTPDEEEFERQMVATDFSSPKATFQTYWDAAKAGAKTVALACCARAARREAEMLLKDTGRFELMALATKGTVRFGRQTIADQRATLEVTVDGQSDTYHFVWEDDGWRITAPPGDD